MLNVLLNVIIPVYALVVAGFLTKKFFYKSFETSSSIFVVLYFFAPALVFYSFKNLSFPIETLVKIFIFSSALFVLLWTISTLSTLAIFKRRIRALEISATVMNAGYLGLPLIFVLFGQKALPVAVSFMVSIAILHFSIGVALLHGESFFKGIKESFKLPLIYAALLAFLLKGIRLPEGFEKMLKLTGDASMPLMLFVLGASLHRLKFESLKLGLWGSFLRLVLGTAVALTLLKFFSFSDYVRKTLLVQASLPSAILNYVLCERFSQEADIAAVVILISTLLSPLWIIFVLKIL